MRIKECGVVFLAGSTGAPKGKAQVHGLGFLNPNWSFFRRDKPYESCARVLCRKLQAALWLEDRFDPAAGRRYV
jgi:hypothetical protein